MIFCFNFSFAQEKSTSQSTQISIATDLTFLKSFKKDQRFWAIGHTTYAHFHFTPKNGAFVNFSYYTPGKFKHELTATAKSILTQPNQLKFTNRSEIAFKHFSLGLKKYFYGTFNQDGGWAMYGTAGLGLLAGSVTNEFTSAVDTSLYNLPETPVSGKGKFKRLTLDLSAGYEIPIGIDVFMYGEGRLMIPTTEYPSKYLLRNDNAPLLLSAHIGVRILFD